MLENTNGLDGWIDVNIMPPVNQEKIQMYNGSYVDCGYAMTYDHGDLGKKNVTVFYVDTQGATDDNVTHWKPLSDPPILT